MQVLKSEQIVACDIDDTILIWGKVKKGDSTVMFTDPYTKEQKIVKVHRAHLKIVKDRLARGATILLWSASGWAWAAAAARAVGLRHPNLYILSKPIAYIDDKKANEFMGEQIFLPADSSYGR